MEIGNIVQIPKASINKICCGQVVVTLAVAVKELIENSLDADATKIDIKFKEHGSELIEVIDNGTGILQGDFENITKMHTTSKLSQFEDLNSISTFGFRGEALGSLCQLGKLSIHTYNPHDSSGTYLVFDSTGQVVSREERARQAGTTVSVCQLFSKLHVRRVELLRNIKREFNRALQILTGYCLACSNAKITCYKIDSKGNKSVILSNDYGATLSQNISTIFGPQQVSSLKTIPEIDSIPNEILEEFRLDGESLDLSIVQIEGLVSSCLPGQGRSSCDRQYLYVNGRPCDIPRLASLINSLYRQYNRTQYPTFVIKIQLPIDSVDVNLAPDKRQIFLTHEKLVSAYVKSCLSFLFDGQNVTGCDFQQMSLIQSPRQVVRSTSPIKSIISQFSPCAAYSPDAAKSSTNLSNLKRFSSPISDSNKNICQPRESQIKRRRTQHLSQFKVTNIKDYLTENEEKHLDNDESIFSKSTPSGDNTEPAAEILHQLNGVDDIAKLDTTVQAEYEKTVYCDPMKCEVIDLSSMIHETGDSQSGESESWRMSQSSSESRADSDRNEEKCVQTFNIVGDCEEVCYQTLSDETVADKSSHFSFYHQTTTDNNSTPTPPVSNLVCI